MLMARQSGSQHVITSCIPTVKRTEKKLVSAVIVAGHTICLNHNLPELFSYLFCLYRIYGTRLLNTNF
jgi:hypothetical protein